MEIVPRRMAPGVTDSPCSVWPRKDIQGKAPSMARLPGACRPSPVLKQTLALMGAKADKPARSPAWRIALTITSIDADHGWRRGNNLDARKIQSQSLTLRSNVIQITARGNERCRRAD